MTARRGELRERLRAERVEPGAHDRAADAPGRFRRTVSARRLLLGAAVDPPVDGWVGCSVWLVREALATRPLISARLRAQAAFKPSKLAGCAATVAAETIARANQRPPVSVRFSAPYRVWPASEPDEPAWVRAVRPAAAPAWEPTRQTVNADVLAHVEAAMPAGAWRLLDPGARRIATLHWVTREGETAALVTCRRPGRADTLPDGF